MIGLSLLVGRLSEYFCSKQILEDELAELRSTNDSDNLIMSKQKEIDDATRNAYLYATGMIVATICGIFLHVWSFYIGQNIGMQVRIITVGAIYHKVCTTYIIKLSSKVAVLYI